LSSYPIYCPRCGRDRFGDIVGNTLHIKHKARNLTIERGVVRIMCVRCYMETTLTVGESVSISVELGDRVDMSSQVPHLVG